VTSRNREPIGKVFPVLLPVASYSSAPALHCNQVHPVADGNSFSMTRPASHSTLVNKGCARSCPAFSLRCHLTKASTVRRCGYSTSFSMAGEPGNQPQVMADKRYDNEVSLSPVLDSNARQRTRHRGLPASGLKVVLISKRWNSQASPQWFPPPWTSPSISGELHNRPCRQCKQNRAPSSYRLVVGPNSRTALDLQFQVAGYVH
jgi:hypothetical protein